MRLLLLVSYAEESKTMRVSPLRRRWNRRSMILASILTSCAATGLGSGWMVGLASRAFAQRASRPPIDQAGKQGHVPIKLNAELRFTNHQQRVRTVAWSPDGTLLASGGDDALVLVWTLNGVIRATIPHRAPIQSLAWSPESQRLITSAASQVRFLVALSGNELAVRNFRAQVTCVAWSGQGRGLAASGLADTRAIVWQTDQYRVQTVFTGHTTAIQAVTFSEDGQTLASSSQGGAVRVWSAVNGGELHPFYLDTRMPVPALAFAPVGASLVAGGEDGVTRLWDALACRTTGTSDQGRICVDAPQRLQRLKQPVRALAWSPDGKYLASGYEDGVVALWSPGQGLTSLLNETIEQNAPVHAIAWSPDGQQLMTAAGSVVTVWRLIF